MSTAVPLYKSRLRGRWPPRTPHISDSAPQQGSDWAKSLLPPLDLHDKHGAGWRWGGGGGGGEVKVLGEVGRVMGERPQGREAELRMALQVLRGSRPPMSPKTIWSQCRNL